MACKSLREKYGYSNTEIFQETERLVVLAAKYEGIAFGGYVRDVVIPLGELGRQMKSRSLGAKLCRPLALVIAEKSSDLKY